MCILIYILIDFSRRLNNLCLIQSKTTTTTKHKKQARNPRCNTHNITHINILNLDEEGDGKEGMNKNLLINRSQSTTNERNEEKRKEEKTTKPVFIYCHNKHQICNIFSHEKKMK